MTNINDPHKIRKDQTMKKYKLELTQEEMDEIVYALVLLKVDAINCLESRIGDQKGNSKQLAFACGLLAQCAELEGRVRV